MISGLTNGMENRVIWLFENRGCWTSNPVTELDAGRQAGQIANEMDAVDNFVGGPAGCKVEGMEFCQISFAILTSYESRLL